jgi:retinol-binding protein 3
MKHHVAVSLALFLVCAVASAQQNVSSADTHGLSREYIHSTIVSLKDLLTQKYFDTASIPRVLQALDAAELHGDYAQAVDAKDLAYRLDQTLAATVHDKHLAVLANGFYPSAQTDAPLPRAEKSRIENYGFKRAEILPGNVGYLEITAFYRANEGSEPLQTAMNFVRHTDALILDLRKNGGGSPDTAIQLLSYFFADPDKPLLSIVTREGESMHYATLAQKVSYRDETRPLYVLVSSSSWSAGEAVPFILQERHRAIVVGEKTSGAANPAGSWNINHELSVTIPYGYIESAVRKTNWEGQGVLPDMTVAPDAAEQVAYRDALSKLLANTSDPARKNLLTKALASAKLHE